MDDAWIGAVGGFAWAQAGLTLIATTMVRHRAAMGMEAATGTQASRDGVRQRLRRVVGWGALLLSLPACRQAWGDGVGWVAWPGVITGCALLLILSLTVAPIAAMRFGRVCLVLGAAMSGMMHWAG